MKKGIVKKKENKKSAINTVNRGFIPVEIRITCINTSKPLLLEIEGENDHRSEDISIDKVNKIIDIINS